MDSRVNGNTQVQGFVDVIQAATLHCIELSNFVIPSTSLHLRGVVSTVYRGLEVWAKYGGLRHLEVPTSNIIESHYAARAHFDHIIRFCPSIECIQGPRYLWGSEERWKVDLQTWERFCQTCNQLESINWITVPFATKFFKAFGAHKKMKLADLKIIGSKRWNWDTYFEAVDPATKAILHRTSFGGSTTDVHALFHATPNLKQLEVNYGAPGFGQASIPRRSFFDDDFVNAIVLHCKQLSRLTYAYDSSLRASDVTGHALCTLASLPDLEYVNVACTTIDHDGLFHFFVNHVACTTTPRWYRFEVGRDSQRKNQANGLCDALKGFLERVASYGGELLRRSQRVTLQLYNGNYHATDCAWSASDFAQVLNLVTTIKQKHPHICLAGLVSGYNPERRLIERVIDFWIGRIIEDIVSWNRMGWDLQEATYNSIDGVFWDRVY